MQKFTGDFIVTYVESDAAVLMTQVTRMLRYIFQTTKKSRVYELQ